MTPALAPKLALIAALLVAQAASAQATPRPAHILTSLPEARPFPNQLGPAGDARELASTVLAHASSIAASSPIADQLAAAALREALLIVATGWGDLDGFLARPGAFAALQGNLPDPSSGANLRAGFGMRTRTTSPTVHRHTGLTYANREQHAAVSVADGVCMFADIVDGLGLVAVVQHNDGYLTVYANLARMAITAGSPVAAGAPLGHTGAGSPLGDDGLYFELRHDGIPIDPIPWLRRAPPMESPLGTSR